jgi:phage tail-like protein
VAATWTTGLGGQRAFGTLELRPIRGPAPPIASRRALLRRGLPALYQDDPFALRLVAALETVLDPLLAVIESLPAYVDAELAPDDTLGLLAGWLGVELGEQQSESRRRDFVRQAAKLAEVRGTRAGLELALHLTFPGLPLRVRDGARVATALEADDLPAPGTSRLEVLCDVPVEDDVKAAVARVIEAAKPAHVPYKLRVRASPAGASA